LYYITNDIYVLCLLKSISFCRILVIQLVRSPFRIKMKRTQRGVIMSNDKPLNRHDTKLAYRCNSLINKIKELMRCNRQLRDIAKHPHRKPQLTAIIDHTRHKIESVSRDLSQLKRAYYSYHKPVKK
jgi:hypothetical protein